MTWIYGTILPLLFFCFGFFAHAANPGDVVINEIAWMGSPPSTGETAQQAANDEWIELYNPTNSPVSLAGWALKAADGNPEITLAGTIDAQGYFLLSRANQKVGDIAADLVYPYKNNALSNDGEYLKLFDAQGNLIDEVTSPPGGWFGGDNTTKQTMERKNPILTGSDLVNWGTSILAGGTPKSQNSLFIPPPQPEPQSKPAPDPTSPPAPLPPLPLAEQQSPALPPEPSPQPVHEIATTTQPVEIPITKQEEPQVPEVKPEVKEVKAVKKVIKKSENKNASPATSTPPSQQVASIGAVAPQNKNIFLYSLAPLLAILSAGTIFLLKKRLEK